ncbi:MAG: chemotaxis protein CheD [Candidatus Omnitrophica bacterium]|nr:chemotaxis protein CheD [Candidatus Omnitrophota bacterium]
MMKSRKFLSENKAIDVDTGEVKAGKGTVTLRSRTIGSCVVVAGYCVKEKIGALAHVMVPGKSPHASGSTKYAIDAIDELLSLLALRGARAKNIEVCLVGGANVLKSKDDTICKNNIDSVIKYLNEKKITIRVTALGGTERRSVSFNIASGDICYTEGDSSEKLLWKVGRNVKRTKA